MAGNDCVILAFEYFSQRALNDELFSVEDVAAATGWIPKTVNTYISKHWKGYLLPVGRGKAKTFKVRKEFLRVTVEEFIGVATQKKYVVPRYQRAKHEVVIQFEFLLPLSKEEHLRRALDELFYADTLIARVHELGLSELSSIIERHGGESDDAYVEKVLKVVSSYFGGYSVFHVQGRFRADVLKDIAGAAAGMLERKRYLIDETTAVVRFITPCNTTKQDFDDDFHSIVSALAEYDKLDQSALSQEITLIRCLFFFFFVEAVIRTVKGEDEIWLLETGPRRRLYKWTKEFS